MRLNVEGSQMVRLGQFQGQYVLYSDTWHPNRENSTQSNAAV